MKNLFFSILMVALCGYAVAQTSETPYLTKSYSGASIQNAEVETSGGGIQVTGVDPSQARVDVFVTGNNMHTLSADEIKERLEKYYTVVISLEGGKLKASARTKGEMSGNFWSGGHALNISFHVFVPRAVSTHLSTSGGGIHLQNLSGEEDFETSGGGLHIDQVAGHIHGRTSGGGIHVSNAQDDIDLSTSGGGITADHCTGKINLSTSGGSLNLTNLSGDIQAQTSGGGIHGDHIAGDLSAHTSGGGIRLAGLSCTLDASTSGGGVDVSMTAIGKSINLNTSAGNITLRLPSGKGLDLTLDANRIETANLGAFNGVTEKEHMKGSVNGGGIPVRLEANSGRISVSCD